MELGYTCQSIPIPCPQKLEECCWMHYESGRERYYVNDWRIPKWLWLKLRWFQKRYL
jgi:hypothetical protein